MSDERRKKRSNWGGHNKVTFKANRTFTNYLRSIGFNYKHTDSPKQYYVNDIGSQVRIDYDEGEITLLNKYGHPLETTSVVTMERIDEFSKGINCEHKKQ